MDSTRMR